MVVKVAEFERPRIMAKRRAKNTWAMGGIAMLGLVAILGSAVCLADPPSPLAGEALPAELSLDEAVRWALEHNPDLVALRQQHGIAAAGVLIAEAYPYNPVLESRVQGAEGPLSGGITNRVPIEHLLFFTVELCGQGEYRRQGASATLSRTDWEIAYQEQLAGVRVARAFQGVLYRQEKVRLAQETIRVNEVGLKQVRQLFNEDKLTSADLFVASTEVDNVRRALGPERASLTTANVELRRALGVERGTFKLRGPKEYAPLHLDMDRLQQVALEARADLRARQSAVNEAEARLRLERADRFGNPVLGPAYGYDPSGVQLLGAQINVPLPLFNTRRGEILLRQAERDRALLDVRRTEVAIRQDVEAAVARLKDARVWVDTYKKEVLPNLEKSLEGIENLFVEGKAGVDLVKVLDIRRKLLQARDGYQDAVWEVTQAREDLAAALGLPLVDILPKTGP
jgi:cobalt-zinc-cadmium efflux system outer membrane protein